MGLKSKCGTIAPGAAEVCGAEAGTVPSRGSGRSSDSRRQTDQEARRAMGPEYGGEPEPLGETTMPEDVQPAGCAALN